jgi:hypothetical protein
MKKRRNLGHLSPELEMGAAIKRWFDTNDLSGSAISQVFESRLDDVEDSQTTLADSLADEIIRAKAAESVLTSNHATLSSSVSTVVDDLASLSSSMSSSIVTINTDITSLSSSMSSSISTINTEVASLSSSMSSSISTINTEVASLSSSIINTNTEVASLSSSLASLSQSFALLSASVGSGGGINVEIDEDAELIFNGDTLMTNADVYISGSGNNLYLHGTNFYGQPTKYEFSVVSGSMFIEEVAPTDFGEEVSDPWFKFDGDTLLTHADIYVSGSNNYLFLNGTDENGDYGIFYFDIVSGSIMIHQTGSV